MSTRSAIVRATGPGTFAGRYVHFDGYPAGVGQALWDLYHGEFDGDLDRMLEAIIDKHPAGWSSIDDYPKSCYCHDRGETRRLTVTQRNAYRLCCEFVYAFEAPEHGAPTMRILAADDGRGRPRWEALAEVALDGREPDWASMRGTAASTEHGD
ncbi:hypothetical protein CCAX7_35250 [Capsulimonas corticalis]|uniref:Uncharacterized protein n=1 Tax=Capsulimonas corticalis TaxID=2219043 RepID=A0A402CY64_9BACT|nr:hypothetical protein [Capsulimonas corticalis]BDI31474.1 hypothetical protein CCAX7_35250 [Capsulimonas corticalis]